MSHEKKRKFKIPSLGIKDNQLAALPWGRQLEYTKKIQEWKAKAESTWLSQKCKSNSKAVREGADLYQAVEWYFECYDEKNYRDDTFEFFYKTQEMLDAEKAESGKPGVR